MPQIAFDPFSTEEMPSKAYFLQRFWEQDLLDISDEVREAISYFLDQVGDEHVTALELVSAWTIAVRDMCWRKQPQLQFPTTKSGYPLFPVMIDIMQLEPNVSQSALAFYRVADPNYADRTEP